MALHNFYPHGCGRNCDIWRFPKTLPNEHFGLGMSDSHSIGPSSQLGRHYWDVWRFPKTLPNQHFGLDMNDSHSIGPPYQLGRSQSGRVSKVANDPNKFQVKMDCSHFTPEEIKVKTVDNNIVIHAEHEEKADEHGCVSREFTRRYILPEECDPNRVVSSLNRYGVLAIEAPKKQLELPKNNERVVPINVVHESSHIECPHQRLVYHNEYSNMPSFM